ncbi:transposase [Actinomyces sp. HPA0247]|uniref:transposase n=1 Tax=Actinomyces sp. HPA0247 TaxID=1203556 RepID=UPI003369F547
MRGRFPRSLTRCATPCWSGSTAPLEAFYPVIYLDAIRIKIRRDHTVENRAAHLAVGVGLRLVLLTLR